MLRALLKEVRRVVAMAGLLAVLAPAAAQPTDASPSAAKGRSLYGSYCARCHGLNMVTPGSGFFDLRTLTPQERERFDRSVTQGIRAMPAWGSVLKPDDVESLWLYVMAAR
jgi:cytochrome c55X